MGFYQKCLIFLLFLIQSQLSYSKKYSAKINDEKKTEKINKEFLKEDFTTPLSYRDFVGIENYFDFSLKDGNQIVMGPKEIISSQMKISFTHLPRAYYSHMDLDSDQSHVSVLSFEWPKGYINEGRIELLTVNGKIFWTKEFNESFKNEWQDTLFKGIDEAPENSNLDTQNRMKKFWKGHWNKTIGLFDINMDLIKMEWDKAIRFCVYGEKEKFKLALCSMPFKFKKKKSGDIKLVRLNKKLNPMLIVGGEIKNEKGRVKIPREGIEFQVIFINGASIKGQIGVLENQLVDIKFKKNGIIGWQAEGFKPISNFKIIKEKNDSWYGDTIKANEELWEVEISESNPEFWTTGYFGIPIVKRIQWNILPTEKDRLFLNKETPTSTYKGRTKMYLWNHSDAELTSSQLSVNKLQDKVFEWEIEVPRSGELNESQILSKKNETSFTSTYKIFRGYPYETSLRLTGGLSQGGMALFSELYGSMWFETLFGWSNYYFGQQRWGVSGRFFNSLTPFNTGSEKVTLTHFNADLKYRLTPGVWGFDESWGFILGFQQIGYSSNASTSIKQNSPMLGFGFFWARSMPRLFDKIFNWIPIFRYPKWVDLDLIYYLQNFNPNHKQGSNFHLNFHGKVFWTKTFYGEAGLAFKQIGITELLPEEVQINSLIVLGTLGLGINF